MLVKGQSLLKHWLYVTEYTTVAKARVLCTVNRPPETEKSTFKVGYGTEVKICCKL
jgi:hypothetical protein